jgi:tRNA A-37 threonylcarbamoyl transferase component Bud32
MFYQKNLSAIRNKQIKWMIRNGYEYLYDKINLDYFISNIKEETYKVIVDSNKRLVVSIPDSNKINPRIYIKHFRRKTKFNLKYLFLPTRSKKEWKMGNKLLSMDVNTAIPLATVEKRSWGLLNLDLIATKEISNSSTLFHFCNTHFDKLPSKQKIEGKRNLLNNLAIFVREIHEKGVYHNDLTSDNIMIKFDDDYNKSDQRYTFYLIDLHHTKVFQILPIRKRLFNIAQIFNTLEFMLNKFDKQEFLKHYENNIPSSRYNFNELLYRIDFISSKIISTHLKSNVRRCLRNKTNFHNQKLSGFKIFARRCYDINSFTEIIKRHHNALSNNDKNVIIKHNSKTTLTKFSFNNNEIHNVVVKQYISTYGRLLTMRSSDGRKSWVSSNGLLVFGFHTPKPLALIEKRMLGITTNSYLITDTVSDIYEIGEYILKNFQVNLSASKLKKKRKFIIEYAHTIGKLHNNNVHHQLLDAGDIMVKENNNFYFTFMNTSKISLFEDITFQKRIKTLTQINLAIPAFISFRDRLRFLREYLKQCNIPGKEKNFLKEIVKLTHSP